MNDLRMLLNMNKQKYTNQHQIEQNCNVSGFSMYVQIYFIFMKFVFRSKMKKYKIATNKDEET